MKRFAVLATAMLATLSAGIDSRPSPVAEEPTVRAQSGASVPRPGSTGVIEGQVVFAGETVPQATRVENTTDPEHCGRWQSLEDIVISPENHGIKNVILALKDVPARQDYQPEPSKFILDNRDCRFQPHVGVLTTGSSIEAVNSDPIFHSVHLYGLREINLALAPNTSKPTYTVPHPGMIIVKCDIHGWMQTFIRVDKHPFHAASAADGSFRIDGIPPGSYTLEVWHEHFGRREIGVSVDAGRVSLVTVTYRAPQPALGRGR